MDAAVTGASGLLGRHLLAALGERAVAVPRDDLAVMAGAEVVLHLAARTVVGEAHADPLGAFEANAALTWRVLAAARDAGVRRVVLASTDAVYGSSAPVPTPEEAPLRPEGAYAASKAAAELVARAWPGPPEVVVVRFANVFGPGDRRLARIVPGTVAAVLAGRAPVIRGDGEAARDLLFAGDAASALVAAARDGVAEEAYNAGTGTPVGVREVVRTVLDVCGADLEPEILGGAAAGEGGRRAVDPAKLRRASGWTARVGLREGIARTVAAEREAAIR